MATDIKSEFVLCFVVILQTELIHIIHNSNMLLLLYRNTCIIAVYDFFVGKENISICIY